MSKFLVKFIQISSVRLEVKQTILTILTMSKRNASQRTIRFNPKVSTIHNRASAPIPMSHKKEKVEVLPEPIKSEADKKIYKTIRLENGLTALLISDPSRPPVIADESSEEEASEEDTSEGETDESSASAASDHHNSTRKSNFDEEKLFRRTRRQLYRAMKETFRRLSRKRCKMWFNELSFDTAACALSVGVGSFSDPAEIQGLAHFVEHMVFMGSEKYPKENEFDSFIKKKGGSDNASTDCEVTTFYFEIQEKYLPQAMDIFSQFFVSPLMNKEAMQREREAIESEFAIAAPSDSNRKDQLLSSLFPEGHPARIFTWGNLKSLKDDINDDEKLHQAAHEFRRRHYSANRMTVAVQARMNLTDLEQHVINTFGRVPTNKLPSEDFSPYTFRPDTVTPEFRSIYYIKPVADNTEVVLTWCLRSLISEYESKPHQYVSYLLGHEGKGSLLSYLRKKVWALGIYTGNSESGIDYTSMYSLFSTQVVLTENGLAHIDEVLEAIFSYISMLKHKGPSERIYDEIKTIEETSFRFDEETQPAELVETLAENMHFYPPEHYITGDRLYYKYDPKGIMELLDCITPDTANIMILSNKHRTPIQYDSKEKWFGTEYKKKDIPEAWMHRWLEVSPYPQFHLPEENIYLTTDFSIIPPCQPYMEAAHQLGVDLYNSTVNEIRMKVEATDPEPMVLMHKDLTATINHFRLDQPNLLRKTRQMELWYKPDFKFRFPTALLYFYFITPLSLKSPREACLLDIWTDSLQQNLKEEVYPANMADLHHSIYVADKGLTVKLSGYNQNLHLLVELISTEMRRSTNKLDNNMFLAIKDVRSRLYNNALLKPHKLAKDLRMQVLLEPYVTTRDKSATVSNITLADLRDFNDRFLNQLYMQVLIQGNVAWYEAVRMSDKMLDNIKWAAPKEHELPCIKVHELPHGENKLRVNSLNKQSSNSIVVNYYQANVSDPGNSAVLEVIMMLMEEPLFDALRTKEQLGYNVFSMMRYTFGVLGFSVTVNCQADKFSVSHVNSRIEAYLKVFSREMKRLSEKTLSSTKQSLVQLKHTVDYELKEEVERNWKEIVTAEYKFDRLYREAEAIEKVKLSDVKRWCSINFPAGSKSQFRKLSVQIVGYKVNEISDNENNTNGNKNYNALTFMNASDTDIAGDSTETSGCFITSPEEFKNDLPILEVPKVTLDEF